MPDGCWGATCVQLRSMRLFEHTNLPVDQRACATMQPAHGEEGELEGGLDAQAEPPAGVEEAAEGVPLVLTLRPFDAHVKHSLV